MGQNQFSLRAIFVATIAVAAAFATVLAEPSWQTALAMVLLATSLYWIFSPSLPA